MVGPILDQRHMTTRLAWARARRRWMLHTWQHILFSEEFRLSLRFIDGRYRVYRKRGKRFYTSVCTSTAVLEAEVLWSGLEFVTQLKIVNGTLKVVKYRDDILDSIVLPFLQQRNFDHAFQHDNARQFSRRSESESHPCSSLAGIITGYVTN